MVTRLRSSQAIRVGSIAAILPRPDEACSLLGAAREGAWCNPRTIAPALTCWRRSGPFASKRAWLSSPWREGEREVQLHAIVHCLRRDPPSLAVFETDQTVAFHGPQCARQIGLGLACDPRQLVERVGRLLGDDAQQLANRGVQRHAENHNPSNYIGRSDGLPFTLPPATTE